ncbi:MAG: hypothetical protein ACRETT_04665 [Steroidobacteraceae bacterium]
MKKLLTWACGTAIALCAASQQSVAQSQELAAEPEPAVSIGGDVAFNSRYMFWGLTLSNRPVWQPDVWLSTHGVTFTVWANNEFQEDSGGSDYTSGGARSGNTEIDYSVDYSWAMRGVESKLGVVRWTYNEDNTGVLGPYAPEDLPAGFRNGPDLDSTEIYASLTWSNVALSPNLSLFYDIDLYRGLFGWVGVSHDVPVGSRSLTLGGLTGFSFGESNTGSTDLPLHAKEGFTHVDLSASMAFEAGSVSVLPNVHVQFNIDDATKATSATAFDEDWVVTFGATLSWSRGFSAR